MQPLNLNLNNVDTTPDRLNKGKYKVVIRDAKFEESKKVQGNWNLLVVFATLFEEVSHKGGNVNPGYQLRSYMPLQQSTNEKAPDFKVQLAKLLDAAFNSRPELNQETVASLVGKEITIRVGLADSEEYGLQNDVKDFEANAE